MKALTLAATLGLTLLANTAVAAVVSDESAVWRKAVTPAENVQAETKQSNDWRPTQFSPVEKAKKDASQSKIWRKVKV